MKITHVTSGLARDGAGIRQMVLDMAKSQSGLGAKVEVVGLEHPSLLSEWSDWEGVSVSALPIVGPRALGYAPQLVRKIEQLEPDLVHLHGLWMYPGRSVLQWSRRARQPYVLSPHGMLSPTALQYSRTKKRIASYWFQKSVNDHASALYATSASEADDFRKYGLKNITYIVPNGVSDQGVQKLRVHRNQSEKVILSLGRIHSIKALDHLVRAWAQLEQEFPDWRVKIIGPDVDGEANRLKNTINHLGIERVDISGPVHGEEKRHLMASADIFALPSRSENFALTVAESLMVGVPVIASRGTPWSRLEQEGCGRWVDIGVEPMSAALKEMMEMEPKLRREMGERGRSWMMREFTWPAVAKKALNSYSDVLAQL